MEWISGWIQGIIIAVIISTIIEMILPEGTSKKYIKVVIGVYILFSMVSPVITKITGNNFKVSEMFELDKYIEKSKDNKSMQNEITNKNQNQIKEIYLTSIKNDIKEKIENKGYFVNNVAVEIENNEQYTLNKINLQVSKNTTDVNSVPKKENTNQIVEEVKEVKINTSNDMATSNNVKTKKEDILAQDKKELKNYLSSVYEINMKNIFINE